jgi:hypothetical protein
MKKFENEIKESFGFPVSGSKFPVSGFRFRVLEIQNPVSFPLVSINLYQTQSISYFPVSRIKYPEIINNNS